MSARADALLPLASLFPVTADVSAEGHLRLGGCDVPALVAEHGTPLYLYDEATLREVCRSFRGEFESRLPGARILYAAKAYLSPVLARLLAEEGLGMDVVSGEELAVAQAGGFPMEQIAFHGNNKSAHELEEALAAGVGRVIVDNFHELELLDRLARARGMQQPALLRITPGVDPHTHAKISTGVVDSKFGFPLAGGEAERALQQALAARGLDVTGIHIHLGSQIFERDPYEQGIEVACRFAAAMRDRHGFEWREFSPGGGFAVAYTPDQRAPAVDAYADAIATALRAACERHRLPQPQVHVEPGRSIVARAGVAVYGVGSRKVIPGVRTYVSVDGGMADNIRPSMYGARYTALVANRVHDAPQETVTVAGKFCESGDILIQEVALPQVRAGDILAVPASGAYQLAMESNYNMAPHPAVLFVRDGVARLTRRRQTHADLLAQEVVPATVEGRP